ncbi:hypothetical protein HPP92_016691 [Vanilla planifolia]|uniref:Transcription repressor n=1 Tax=Vanilla planifolia TaxID=51239 RepID=A0A835QFA2_VANPL|nr:hypothetical protein HPP92_016691 [Vanilla planifolia]
MHRFMGRQQSQFKRPPCTSLCCCGANSRPSVSSAASSEDFVSSGTEPLHTISSIAHAMVQERLATLIEEQQWRGRGRTGDGKLIVLVAMDKHSYEPRMDFMQSMMDVITTKGLKEPTELRNLLNCYIKMNPSEQRQAILEAFHEVCSVLFPCGG